MAGEPLMPPIHLSVTYTYDVEGLLEGGWTGYSRESNPTVEELEARLAALEGARWALAFNSGMAAITGLLLGVARGRRIILERLTYGSTRLLPPLLGLEARLAGPPWDELLHEADSCSGGVVFVESMGNPTLRIPPLEELVGIASERGCLLVVDNTMATPAALKPLKLGAALVVESLTKYVVGHNDALGGSLAGLDPGLRAPIWEARRLTGTILQPFEAYLAIRGLETLEARYRLQSATALEVARWLEESGLVERVYYPCLESHPDHARAQRLLGGLCGGVLSFDVGTRERALEALSRLRLVKPSASFGATKPMAAYPYASSHRSLPEEEKKRLGITPGLIRLSVGMASPQEIIGDLERALKTH